MLDLNAHLMNEHGLCVELSVSVLLDGMRASVNQLVVCLELDVLVACERREAPLVGDDDVLSAGELVLCASQRLDDVLLGRFTRSHTEDDLSNVDSCDETVRLSERTSHTGLQSNQGEMQSSGQQFKVLRQ